MVAGHLQEKKGYFYCVLNYKDADGKRKTKWISTGLEVKGNKKRAEKLLIEERRNFKVPTQITDDDLLFSDFLMEHWLPVVKSNIELTTYGSYLNMCESVIVPYFKEKKIMLKDMKPKDIQDFYTLQAQRVKASTVKHYHAIIHKALEHAIKLELLMYNPSDRVEKPRVQQFIAEYYSAEELTRLFEATKEEDIGLLIKLTAFYGFRKSEALGLKWSAIDFDNNTITIRHVVTQVNVDGKKHLVQKDRTKRKASYRTMPLVDDFKTELLKLKEQQAYYKQLCKKSYDTRYEEYVFVDSMGTIFEPNYVSRRFKALLKKNGLKDIRFHDLRHSSASALAKAGVQMKQIQEWLGHSDYSTTANIYAHLQSDAKMQTAESMLEGLKMETGKRSKEKEAPSKDEASIM